jgi:hypothetical protein
MNTDTPVLKDRDRGQEAPRIDPDAVRAWLDVQLARQGITAPTITNRATLTKLATLAYAGLDPTSNPSPEGGSRKGRTRGRSAGERRSGQ